MVEWCVCFNDIPRVSVTLKINKLLLLYLKSSVKNYMEIYQLKYN